MPDLPPSQPNGQQHVPPVPEGTSLLGLPLYARDAQAGLDFRQLEEQLAHAQQAAQLEPDNLEKLLTNAELLGELSRYRAAIKLYDTAISQWPTDQRAYVQRGRRYLNLREFILARADLGQALQLEPAEKDALFYLGITRFLERDYPVALAALRRSLRAVGPEDGTELTSLKRIRRIDWLFMTLLRLDRHDEAGKLLARVSSVPVLNENMASFLSCFRFYQGEQEEQVTRELMGRLPRWGNSRMYGLGNWHQCHGEPVAAAAYYARTLNTTNWPSFTFIAAELELAAGI